MIRTITASTLALALFGAGIAMAAAPTPVPNAAPDFSSMKWQLGTWHCHQHITGRPGDRTETDTYTMAYDGWQMDMHVDSPPFDQYRTRDEIGDTWTTWDSTIKTWASTSVDNFGAYGLASSPGWVGNTITWTAVTLDGTVGRTVVTKVSDSKMTVETWGNTKKGGPVTVQFTGTCTKP